MKFPNTFKFPDDSILLELTLKNDIYNNYFQISKPQYTPQDRIAIPEYPSVWSASMYTIHLQFREYHYDITAVVLDF